jgi:hypothetical protein
MDCSPTLRERYLLLSARITTLNYGALING